METITLHLPKTLRHQLEALARSEGVSLDQYLVYALTRQVASAYHVQAVPAETQQQEREAFAALLKELDSASDDEVDRALAEREPAEPESELSADVAERL